MFTATAIATAFIRGAAILGWTAIFAVDLRRIRADLPDPLHNTILSVLIVVSIGIIAHATRHRGGRGHGYAEGVVDGLKLATGHVEESPSHTGTGAQVLYLHSRRAGVPCTRRAPKPVGMRSSS